MRARLFAVAAAAAAAAVAGCADPAPARVATLPPPYPTPRYFVQSGLALAGAPPVRIADALPALDGAARSVWDAAGYDRYVVLAHGDAVVAYGENPRALGYARAAAAALVDGDGRVHEATLVDGSPLPARGLIEGYYGTPLSPSQRACLVATMATLKQNTYLYGPKDDPFAHQQWADLYPPDAAAAIADAAVVARAHDVDFVWAASPGLQQGYPAPGGSISYASDDDFARLTAKIDAMRALGVERFALFLDDIEGDLVYDADRAAFATPADAHAALANRLDAYVTATGAPHLLFVGPVYSTRYDDWSDWADEIGARLRPGIDVLWTGTATFSGPLAAADLRAPDAAFGRAVVLWDNEPEWPVAIAGRAADLPDALGGFLTNLVMIERGSTFADFVSIAGTLGDWSWNPRDYDPERSLSDWSSILRTSNPCGDASDTS
jgi:hyaluronoglucosaminidase